MSDGTASMKRANASGSTTVLVGLFGLQTKISRVRSVTTELRDAGYQVPPSQANFVWLPLPGRAQEFASDSANNRVIVRPYGEDGVRVTVAARHENDAFLDFAKRWIAGQ